MSDHQSNNPYSGISFLNVFLCYYKKLFNKEQNTSMFHDIDNSHINSTNRCMELLYEEIYKFKSTDDENLLSLYEPDGIDINECKELYVLTIDNKYNKVCQYILPLIKYVSDMDNWQDINWSIIQLK